MKKFLVAVLLSLMLLIGCACGNDSAKTLNIYNWGQYMDPQVLKDFTAETGIPIQYEEYPTNEDMYIKVKAGSEKYDLIIPSDYMIEKMASEDLLLPLDMDNIPNIKNIDPKLMGLPYDPAGKYSLPFTWGTVGIVYNQEEVTEPVDSWDILWDEKYAKEILMLNSSRDSLCVALSRLGYSINTRSVEELEEAKNMLIEQKPLVLAYVVDEVRDMMLAGEAKLAVVWSGEGMMICNEDSRFKYVVPQEGGNVWVDALAIPKTAENKEWAEEFINYVCRGDVAAKIMDYIGYATPNLEAQAQLPADVLNNVYNYPSAEMMLAMEFFRDPTDMLPEYDRVWTEVSNY